MVKQGEAPILVPVGTIGQKLDNDDPDYVFAPDLYMTLALAYDSLGAPQVSLGSDGILQPSYETMQPRLAVGLGRTTGRRLDRAIAARCA
jgi:hypothetical protein